MLTPRVAQGLAEQKKTQHESLRFSVAIVAAITAGSCVSVCGLKSQTQIVN